MAISSQEEKGFSFKDFIIACLAAWKWFALSIIICLGLGAFQYLRQQPVYARSMLVLIQDDNSSAPTDLSGAMKNFGFGGASTNVFNEMVSMTSPAVMFEVVERLKLYVNVDKLGFPHEVALYKNTSPFDFVWPEKTPLSNAKFKMTLNPDDTFEIYEFSYVPQGAKERHNFERTIKGKIGFQPVGTPVGALEFRPNGLYNNDRTEPIDLAVNVTSDKSAVEKYTAKFGADLENADADVIELTITDVIPKRAEDILSSVVDVYNEFWVRDKNRMAVATADFITDRLNTIVKELGEVDGEIADYQKDHKIIDLQENAKMTLTQTSVLDKDYLELSNNLAMAKYVRDYVSNPANANAVVPINSGIGSTALEKEIADYNTLVLTLDNLKANSSSSNPIVKDYELRVRGLHDAMVKSINSQIGSLEARLANLNGAISKNSGQITSAPSEALYLGTIKRDQAVKESLYLFLLEKREENNLTQAFNAYNTRIINPPYGPTRPISPNKMMTIVISLFMGCLIPALVIYMRSMTDNKIRSRSDLENLPIPFTGEIPQVGRKSRFRKLFMTKKRQQKIVDAPKPLVEEGKRDVPNEAFRVVRSNIDLMLGRNHSHNILALTSLNPGSGKSFICYNLGASFALKKKRVLLIDGDLRHGSLSNYIGKPSRGLTSYLTRATSDISKIIYPVEGVENLSIIPVGHRPPNPAELLEGPELGHLLESLKEQYDIILIDCPPVNIVVDTQIIAHFADATLFVVRAGLLERRAIKDLNNIYHEHKLNRMCLILNGTEEVHSSYYAYGNYQSLED